MVTPSATHPTVVLDGSMVLKITEYAEMLWALALMPMIRCSPPEMRLMNDLLAGYVREERPVLDSSKPVVVTLGIAMQQIINLVR
ncbi:unnamed protein product [Haemonchus placei]|uniref:Neur_chan_LBD domain-containing protein n=1 Tax=Haemonchus placei TaxID=6290 RepID=A0A0N4W185_HAEPC|nr:unnamed protein product [Haemonchus placei]